MASQGRRPAKESAKEGPATAPAGAGSGGGDLQPRGNAFAAEALAAETPEAGTGAAEAAGGAGKVGWGGPRGFNEGVHTVDAEGNVDDAGGGGVTRVPLDGIAGVPTGKVVALVPSNVASLPQVDVLLHFHGYGPGNNQRGDRTNDLAVSQIGQQIAASQRPMIGILPQMAPQGQTDGPSPRANTRIDSPTCVASVFAALRGGYLTAEQAPGRTIFSGHSAGGAIATHEAAQSLEGEGEHDEVGGLFLFDGERDPRELEGVLGDRLAHDKQSIERLGSAEEQVGWLDAHGFVFESVGGTGYYVGYAAQAGAFIERWFGSNAREFAPEVVARWRANYSASRDADANSHDAMVSTGRNPHGWKTGYEGGGNLEHALRDRGSGGAAAGP